MADYVSYVSASHGANYISGWGNLAQISLLAEWLLNCGWSVPRYSDGTTIYYNREPGTVTTTPGAPRLNVYGIEPYDDELEFGGLAFEAPLPEAPPNIAVVSWLTPGSNAWLECRSPGGKLAFTVKAGANDTLGKVKVHITDGVTTAGFTESPTATSPGRPTASLTGTGDSFGKSGSNVTLTDAATTFTSALIGQTIVIAGATSSANNGAFTITAATGNTITWVNAAGVIEAFAGTWSVHPEYYVIGSPTVEGTVCTLAADSLDLYVTINREAPYQFCAYGFAKSGASNAGAFGVLYDPIANALGDTKPGLFYWLGGTNPFSYTNMGAALTAPVGWLNDVLGRIPANRIGNPSTATLVPGGMVANPVTGKHSLFPVPYGSANGRKGVSSILAWVGTATIAAPQTLHCGTRLAVDQIGAPEDFMVCDNVAIISDGAAPVHTGAGVVGTTADAELVDFSGVAGASEAPVIDAPTPASGSEINRLQLITIPISDDVGIEHLIVNVEMDGQVFAAFDDLTATDSFAAGGSSWAGGVLSLRPEGGWTGSPTIHVIAIDADGGVDEETFSYTVTHSSYAPAAIELGLGQGGIGLGLN